MKGIYWIPPDRADIDRWIEVVVREDGLLREMKPDDRRLLDCRHRGVSTRMSSCTPNPKSYSFHLDIEAYF